MRQIVAPIMPEAGFAERELAVDFDVVVTFLSDFFLPRFRRFGVRRRHVFQLFGKHIQIVDIAEEILEALEIVAPGGGVFGEQTFESVAESFQADAEGMPGFGFFGAEGAVVKFFGILEAFEGQAFGGEASHGNDTHALTQAALEIRPIFLVELCRNAKGFFGALFLVEFERLEQLVPQRIILRSQLFDPFFHHLSIAERTEASKKFAGDFAHFRPRGVGVNFFHDRREGTAAANGDAQIVDGVGIGGRVQLSKLFQNAIHPMREAAVFGLWASELRTRDR